MSKKIEKLKKSLLESLATSQTTIFDCPPFEGYKSANTVEPDCNCSHEKRGSLPSLENVSETQLTKPLLTRSSCKIQD